MKKRILLLVAFVAIAFSAHAQGKSKNAKVQFEVKGNCEMCKERIEKAAKLTKGVKFATWNVDTKEFYCIYNENKISELEIKKAIAKAGHDSEDVKATKEAYDSLHECCKYDRESNTN